MNPGCIVKCRNRDWVLMPSDRDDVHLLRPLTGATDEIVAINKRLMNLVGSVVPEERIVSAQFPLPQREDVSDAVGAHLLWQSARLTLREGATPFRSLGRISIRPRVYQFVPLLMALRLDPVRLLIADDVGVGKTIEALLIARELYDRGEIKRIGVLCPPYLCEQWQKEIADKFNLEAVIIRAGTVNQLERRKTNRDSIYRYYPIHVASIDLIKDENKRRQYLLDCPDLVIVDEAHGSARSDRAGSAYHQRHELITAIAARPHQHLVMLTATPHSGIEAAFRSLITFLSEDFRSFNTDNLSEQNRIDLARHFVQRTRADIVKDWEGERCFPERESSDHSYRLSSAYHTLFERTYSFCSEIVRGGETLNKRQQRVRYWGALALLRCVMSSPAAAEAAFNARYENISFADDEADDGSSNDTDYSSFIFEATDERTDDSLPLPPVEGTEQTLPESDKRRLRAFAAQARELLHSAHDTKLARCVELVRDLLTQGYNPIIYCRYIATAEYVAEGLNKKLGSSARGLRIVSITGRIGDEERQEKIADLARAERRVLVATDCLSEGVNLQEHFDAVIHYDLPWNPNRLEQREGRVDRYGQPKETVKALRFFGQDNAIDGVVIKVLLDKARTIRNTLGTYVPVPEESESVTEALLQALFFRDDFRPSDQLTLDLGVDIPELVAMNRRWDANVEREKVSRTRFAQHAIKPAEVRAELEETDRVLGDPGAVRTFVLAAGQRLMLPITPDRSQKVFTIAVDAATRGMLPAAIGEALPKGENGQWRVSFGSPTPAGCEYVGRNHRLVSALARYLMEEALTRGAAAIASRCGVIRTRAVTRLTTIILLRARYLVTMPDRPAMLSEEVRATGYVGLPISDMHWLDSMRALELLAVAQSEMNLPMAEKQELVSTALSVWPDLEQALAEQLRARAAELRESHRRIRQAVSLRVRSLDVEPQLPPDLLGLLILQPLV